MDCGTGTVFRISASIPRHRLFAQPAFRAENQAMAEDVRGDLFDIIGHHKIKAAHGRKRLGATEQRHRGARTAAQGRS